MPSLHLKNLTRAERVEHMTKIMINFHDIYPFKEENRHPKQLFIEITHQSSRPKAQFFCDKSKIFVRSTATHHGDPEPIKHSLESIFSPEELLVLKEF